MNVETMAAARAVTRENNAVLKAARAAAKAAARAHEVSKSLNVTIPNPLVFLVVGLLISM